MTEGDRKITVGDLAEGSAMVVVCDRCAALGAACGDCVLSAVVGAPPTGVELDEAEVRALAALADAGLVPRRRRVRVRDRARARGPADPLPRAA